MNIHIEPLTRERAEDFLRFFDHDAFSDHEEWAGCYCLESHLTPAEDAACNKSEKRRSTAKKLIREGTMQGYLLYDGDAVVGWCNAGDKRKFLPVYEDPAYHTGNDRIKVVYCMDIAPAYRGKGLATLALERVLADAENESYAWVEGYPLTIPNDPYPYKGPPRLYEKFGFTVYRKTEEFYILRKAL